MKNKILVPLLAMMIVFCFPANAMAYENDAEYESIETKGDTCNMSLMNNPF